MQRPNRCQLLNETILGLMNTIEDMTGLIFHEYDRALEQRCMDVMDSKNAGQLNMLIKDLEEIVSKGVTHAKAE